MNRNPILQLKEQEEITIGGVGGRAARDVKALLAPLPSSIMDPDFQDAIVHELQFGKVERHPRKAMRSYKRASKAMVRGFLKEVKHHG